MSKKKREEVAQSATQEGGEAAPTAEKKVRKPPVPKELADEMLYLCDHKYTDASTVFGAIRQFVFEKGGKAMRSEITAHMIANYKPKKSTMGIEPYVKSYMRDVVKLRFLTNKEEDAVTTLTEKPVREKRESTKDANGLSETGKKILKALAGELTAGEVADGTSSVTVESLAGLVSKNVQNLRMSLKSLVNRKLATINKTEDKELVILTQAGWDLANAPEATAAAA